MIHQFWNALVQFTPWYMPPTKPVYCLSDMITRSRRIQRITSTVGLSGICSWGKNQKKTRTGFTLMVLTFVQQVGLFYGQCWYLRSVNGSYISPVYFFVLRLCLCTSKNLALVMKRLLATEPFIKWRKYYGGLRVAYLKKLQKPLHHPTDHHNWLNNVIPNHNESGVPTIKSKQHDIFKSSGRTPSNL